MLNELTITIPGAPISKKRPRFARRGKFVTTYNPQESEEGKFICLMQNQIKHDPIQAGTPIYLILCFNMPIPASTTKKMRLLMPQHTKKPDLDNLIKFVKDCANGILWHDDSQVISVNAVKMYSEIPSTYIRLEW
jgi:Holliday junction resolvase RusA-like endonuclease